MGERLGRYTVLKHLASGGMADVLLARTDGTGDGIEGFARHVVLKRIRAEHANDRRFIDMFLDEARLAATLHHQNIVQVHDIGEADGAYFFAMEYLHGEDVRTILGALTKTRAHLPLEHVVGIVSAAAAGLHYAHERRDIVHRDVSPSNILVGYDGSVKVVDFGIAKAAMRDGETRSGVKGKVSYLSPEQCKLGAVDRRSDVYSLGVVLYELATSTRLFKSESDYLVMDAICTGKIPAPRVRRPDLPPELTSIIMKALATDTANRYQTADELRTALDQFAVATKLSTSAPALAAYLRKLFGEKPEPWLDGPAAPRLPDDAKSGTGTGRKRNVHDDRATRPTDLPPSKTSTEMAAARPPTDPGTTTTTDGKAVAAPVPPAVEPAAEHVDVVAPSASSPSASSRAFTPRTIAMIAVPVAAVLGFVVWKVASGGAGERAPAPSASSALTSSSSMSPSAATSSDLDGANPREATVAHGSAGASTDVAGDDTAAGAGSASTTGAATESAASTTNAAPASAATGTDATPAATKGTEGTATAKNVSATATAKNASATATAKNVSAAATARNASTTATAKNGSATATAANSTSATSVPGTGTSATAAATKETSAGTTVAGSTTTATNGAGSAVGAQKTAAGSNAAPAALPKIARVVVDNIATHNRKQIARCEGTEELRGEISVRFEVDATGRVVKSSVASTVKNTKVVSCLHAAVKSWQFPKTAATGVYTVTYY